MPIIFETTAYDDKKLRLTEIQWMHIVFFHPEVTDEKKRIEETIKSPDVVIEGATRDTKLCYKLYHSTPVSSSKYLAVVIRVLNEEGVYNNQLLY